VADRLSKSLDLIEDLLVSTNYGPIRRRAVCQPRSKNIGMDWELLDRINQRLRDTNVKTLSAPQGGIHCRRIGRLLCEVYYALR